MVFSAYLLVSLHADELKQSQSSHNDDETQPEPYPLPFSKHRDWELETTWKSTLNNLRLLLQPYWCWAWLEQWLQVFPVPGLKRVLHQLMDWMDTFQILLIPDLKAA